MHLTQTQSQCNQGSTQWERMMGARELHVITICFFVLLLRSSSLLMIKLRPMDCYFGIFHCRYFYFSINFNLYFILLFYSTAIFFALNSSFYIIYFFPDRLGNDTPCLHHLVCLCMATTRMKCAIHEFFFLKESRSHRAFPPRPGYTQQSMGRWRPKIISDDNNSLKNGDFKVESREKLELKSI